MNKNLLKLLIAIPLGLTLFIGQTSTLTMAETKVKTEDKSPKQISVGYYPYYGDFSSINAANLTHLNFAFGYIYHNETLPRPNMIDPSKTSDENLIGTIFLPETVKASLKRIPELKNKNKDLKTLLSLGGWGGRGFCDAAATKESRLKTANSIKNIITEYGLDGVDIDWECPVNGGWGEIKFSPEDRHNYTLLVKDLREVLGNDKLITIASGATWDYIVAGTEFAELGKILDFINVMNYAYSYGGPKYDSALYKSSNDPGGINTDDLLKACVNQGVPKEKLVMGTAFFGKIPTDNSGAPNYINMNILSKLGLTSSGDYGYAYNYIKTLKNKAGVEERWDDESKNPYLVYVDPVTKTESFIISFDNAKSMLIKGRYAKENGYGGVMVWEVTQDSQNELLNNLYNGLYTDFSVNKAADLNNDGIVDTLDISYIASQYNLSSTNINFNTSYDLNDDNIVDIYDIVLLSRTFSKLN
ncbi:glycosyl hydrolase family 18 protein [Clostridium sp. LP20]|uniref:glycosyl hydrolase family 18 protein n=1 Tax=Clostridium sp. LP20 TaxID=3418665 RepID=UPI003EE6C8B6